MKGKTSMKPRRVSMFPFALLGLLGIAACAQNEVVDVASVQAPDTSDKPTGASAEAAPNGADYNELSLQRQFDAWLENSPTAGLPGFPSTVEEFKEQAKDQSLNASSPTPQDFTFLPGACWIDQFGTTALDQARSVAADPDNNVYVVGTTQGSMSNSGGTGASTTLGVHSGRDIFVRKYNANKTLAWSRQLGTQLSKNDVATGVVYSAQDNGAVYVTGYTNGVMPAGSVQGTFVNTNPSTADDLFLAKFSRDGELLWTRQIGTTAADQATSIAVENKNGSGHPDANGEVVIAGWTKGVFPGNTLNGNDDAFVIKYLPDGSLRWIRQFGTSRRDQAQGVAIDRDTNIYVTGFTEGGFGMTNQANRPPFTSNGGSDVFVTKWTDLYAYPYDIDQRGSAYADVATSIAVGRKDDTTNLVNVYVAGYTLGKMYSTSTNPANSDALFMQYGNVQTGAIPTTSDFTFVNGKQSDNAQIDKSFSVAADGLSIPYVLTQIGAIGAEASFLWKYDPALSIPSIGYAIPAPTGTYARGWGIAADYDKGVYAAGGTTGAFDYPWPGTQTTNIGGEDAFLLKSCIGCTFNTYNPACVAGWGWGDPHLRTFDGHLYDFQADGEFVLVERTAPGNSFMLQARQRVPSFNPTVGIYKGLATMLGSDRVAFYSDESSELRINGQPITLTPGNARSTAGNGLITRRQDGAYVLDWPTGERALLTVYPGSNINLNLLLIPNDFVGAMRGLLGNFDGNSNNDFALRSGMQLPAQPSFAEMYTGPQSFANSWRISQSESLFDYGPGQTTLTFTDLTAPQGTPSMGNVPAHLRTLAEQICANAGVTDPVLLHQCIMDVALMNNASLSESAALMQSIATTHGITLEMPAESTVYSSDMSNSPGSEWSTNSTCISPLGDRTMLGEFGNEVVSLNLPSLPPHEIVTVTFDVVIINGWDGDGPLGPNEFGLYDEAEGSILSTTFSNTSSVQSYPGAPGSNNPAGSSANEVNMLYYPYGDSVYTLSFTYPHTSNDLRLHFYAQGLSGLTMESWAIDNVNIVVGPANP